MRGKKGFGKQIKNFAKGLPKYYSPNIVQHEILQKFNVQVGKATIYLWRRNMTEPLVEVSPYDNPTLIDLAPQMEGKSASRKYLILKEHMARTERYLADLKYQVRTAEFALKKMRIELAKLRYERAKEQGEL